MDITLKNVGIIKNSTIKLEGLTVITGKNNSGKTTVGKIVNSILRAMKDSQQAFENAKREYIRNQIDRMSDSLFPQINYFIIARKRELRLNERIEGQNPLKTLLLRQYTGLNANEIQDFLEEVVNAIKKASIEEINQVFGDAINETGLDFNYRERYQESFQERIQVAESIGRNSLKTVRNTKAYISFLQLRIQDFLNKDFANQVKPVRDSDAVTQVELREKDSNYLSFEIREKNEYVFSELPNIDLPYERSVFIDDPFIMDRIQRNDFTYFSRASIRGYEDNLIHSTDLISYSEEIGRMLRTNLNGNFFDMYDFQNAYHNLFEKINAIVPGEFQETQDGQFYINEDVKLNVNNLATGSKLFFLIKQLILKGHISKGTLLILDEPESHLHPEWINKFAEIVILLIKEMGIYALITTHSPNLLLALDVYSKKNEIDKYAHFYLARQSKEDWSSDIYNIDDNIREGYGHLSVPFLEMSYLNKQEDTGL